MVSLVKEMSKKELDALSSIIYDHVYYGIQYRRPYLERHIAATKFYNNDQLSSREKELLNLRGQEHFIVNHLRPNLRSLQGFLTSNKPTWNVVAVGEDDTMTRKIANGLLSYIYDISTGYHKIYRITKDGILGGMGNLGVFIDYRRRKGLGDVIIKDIPPENFIQDWRVKDPYDPWDIRFQAIHTIDYITTAIAIRPDLRKEIVNKYSIGYDSDMSIADSLVGARGETTLQLGKIDPTLNLNTSMANYIEYYRIYEQKTWKLIDKYTGKEYSTPYEPEIVYPNSYDITRDEEPVIEKYLCLYNGAEVLILDKEVYPMDVYPVHQFIDEDTGNLYPLGEIYFTKDLQRWANKSYQQTLLHTQMASNPNWWVDKHEDIEELEKKIAIAGSILGIDMSRGKPVQKQVYPLNPAWFTFVKDMEQQIRNQIGTYAPFTGDPSYSKGNATETLLLQEKGAERAKVIFRNFELALEGAGKAAWKLSKYHYDFPMWLNWLDQGKGRKVFLNGITVGEGGKLTSTYLKDIDVDIKLVTSSYQPVNNIAHVDILQNLYSMSPEYARAPLFLQMLKYLQIDQNIIDEIEQNSQIVPQLIQQLQQAQEQIKQLGGVVQGMQKKQITQDQKVAKKEYEADLSRQLSKARANIDVTVDKFKNRLESKIEKTKVGEK